ncbi:hypothetical protein [Cupriavidus consociatus]
MAGFLDAIDRNKPASPDFREAWEIQRVVDAAIRSSSEMRRIAL